MAEAVKEPEVDVEDTVTVEFSRPELESLIASVDESIMKVQADYGQNYGDTADEVCQNLRGVSDELDRCFDARELLVDALAAFEEGDEEDADV